MGIFRIGLLLLDSCQLVSSNVTPFSECGSHGITRPSQCGEPFLQTVANQQTEIYCVRNGGCRRLSRTLRSTIFLQSCERLVPFGASLVLDVLCCRLLSLW